MIFKKPVFIKLLGLLLVFAALLGPGISYSNFYLFHFFLLLFMAFFGLLIFRKGKIIRSDIQNNQWTIFDFFLPITILWFLLSFLWAESEIHTLYYIAFLTMGTIIFFVLKVFLGKTDDQKYLLLILGIAIGLEFIVWLMEFTTSFKWFVSIASPYLEYFGRASFNPHLYEGADLKNILSFPSGFHWNPNNLALVFALAFPFFLLSGNRWIGMLGSIACVIIIFSTGSRICFLALLFGMLISLLVLKKRHTLSYLVTLLSIVLLSTNAFSTTISKNRGFREIQLFVNSFISFQKDENVKDVTANSDGVRWELMVDGFEALKDSYGLGIGGGNDVYLQEIKGGHGEKHITFMHNFWLELLVNGGFVVALIWMVWYIRTLFKLWQKSKESKKFLYIHSSVFIALCIFLPGAVSPSSCIYFLPMYILLGWGNQLCVIE